MGDGCLAVGVVFCKFVANMDKKDTYTPGLYERAAYSGGVLGLYLTVLFAVNAYTQSFPLLALVGLALMACVPVMVYMRLSRSYIAGGRRATFSELWLEGIVTFFFATLIVSLASVVFMTWIQPDWFIGQLRMAVEQGEASQLPQLQEMAGVLKAAMVQRVLPTPMQMALDMGWLILFTGSILSMVVAAIVRARIKQK